MANGLASREREERLRHIYCFWMNGELVPFDEAAVHFLNPTQHYGAGILEGIGCYETERGPALFRPEAHLTRFLNRVRLLGIEELRYDLMELRRAAHVTVQVNNYSSCYVRPALYFAGGADGAPGRLEPTVAVTASGWGQDGAGGENDLLWQEKRQRGIRMMIADGNGTGEAAGEALAAGPAVNGLAARAMARRKGYEEAILLDAQGRVTGCTAETLFVVHNNVLMTPPQPDALPGVARDTVITLAGDLGYEVRLAPVTEADLASADELFVCSTAAEVMPVRELDGRILGDGGAGAVTARLQQLYADTVRGRGPRSRGWIEYVMMEPLF
jgi:branched-chain amino acid aminotransferase